MNTGSKASGSSSSCVCCCGVAAGLCFGVGVAAGLGVGVAAGEDHLCLRVCIQIPHRRVQTGEQIGRGAAVFQPHTLMEALLEGKITCPVCKPEEPAIK